MRYLLLLFLAGCAHVQTLAEVQNQECKVSVCPEAASMRHGIRAWGVYDVNYNECVCSFYSETQHRERTIGVKYVR